MHGFLLLDKPVGISSARLVSRVKRLTKQKVGHGGTLDPLASGLLPLALGEATKAIRFALTADKTYEFTVTFGESRSTDDAEGEVVERSTHMPTADEIIAVLPDFTGDIKQTPPAYSAIKIDGKRAYALARDGKMPEMQARQVQIYALALLNCEGREAKFSVSCGKGTYVRSLGRDIASKLGSCGYISALRRTKLGKFSIDDAFLLDETVENMQNARLKERLITIDAVLDDIPALYVTDELAIAIRHGKKISLSHPLLNNVGDDILSSCGSPLYVRSENGPVALAQIIDSSIKVFRVFNQT